MNTLFDNLPESELDSIQESAQAGIAYVHRPADSPRDSAMFDADAD